MLVQISGHNGTEVDVHIRGIEGLTLADVEHKVAAGGRFVFFDYCMSFVIFTVRRPSGIHFLPVGKGRMIRGISYALVSLLMGWWGLPWGLIYTPLTLITSLSGGCDVTEEVLASLKER